MNNKIIMKFSIAFLLSFFVVSSSIAGQIFKWEDSDGVMHFTDDRRDVPEEYLDQLEEVIIEPGIVDKSFPKTETPVKSKATGKKTKLYGDNPVSWWASKFQEKRKYIYLFEKQIKEKKDFIAMMDRIFLNTKIGDQWMVLTDDDVKKYHRYKKELPGIESKLKKAEKDLAELTRKATYNGVPKKIRATGKRDEQDK